MNLTDNKTADMSLGSLINGQYHFVVVVVELENKEQSIRQNMTKDDNKRDRDIFWKCMSNDCWYDGIDSFFIK